MSDDLKFLADEINRKNALLRYYRSRVDPHSHMAAIAISGELEGLRRQRDQVKADVRLDRLISRYPNVRRLL
jgi:hypothetical protein